MKKVYLSIGTSCIHGGHIEIIQKAAALGELTVGVLTDEVLCTLRGMPLLPFVERCNIIRNIVGVHNVIAKTTTGYKSVIEELHPDYVVHGDVWRGGGKQSLLKLLKKYGGELVEFPYNRLDEYINLEQSMEKMRTMPEYRRRTLKKLLQLSKRALRAIEAHSGITGLIAEKTQVQVGEETRQFDAIWISSLCDSTNQGKPDIELVDMTSRISTINEIMEVTTKPIILDGDTGGLVEHFVYNVKTLERLGVSAIIIEDKKGLKQNSLFGNDVFQEQESIVEFSNKLKAGKKALVTKDFMIIARVESLILQEGLEDALERAFAYVEAGADGIMIHSKEKSPDEVIEFCKAFRQRCTSVPIVTVPTTYCSVTENELYAAGSNIVIYANHLMRSAYPAMKQTAEMILKNERAQEADQLCMPIKEILTLL